MRTISPKVSDPTVQAPASTNSSNDSSKNKENSFLKRFKTEIRIIKIFTATSGLVLIYLIYYSIAHPPSQLSDDPFAEKKIVLFADPTLYAQRNSEKAKGGFISRYFCRGAQKSLLCK